MLNGEDFETKIYNGLEDPGQDLFPYYVLLQIVEGGSTFLCGGSLVTQSHVLTAAHCLTTDSGAVADAAGVTVTDRYGTVLGVSTVLVNPDYNPAQLSNDLNSGFFSANSSDIAMVVLSTPSQAPTVNLPQPGEPTDGQTLYAAGRGLTETGDLSSVLKYTTQIVGDTGCHPTYSDQFCAGNTNGVTGTCSGDSGGPIVIKGNTPADDVLVGLTSWGPTCGESAYFGWYTRVSDYLDLINAWINGETPGSAGSGSGNGSGGSNGSIDVTGLILQLYNNVTCQLQDGGCPSIPDYTAWLQELEGQLASLIDARNSAQ